MRRSVYQKKFFSGSVLYAAEPEEKPKYQRAYHSFIEPTVNTDYFLDSKTSSENQSDGARSLLAQQSDDSFILQPNYERYSCSGLGAPSTSKEHYGRPFRSADFDSYNSPEFVSNLRRDRSEDSDFKKSQESDIFVQPSTDGVFHNSETSSGSYISQRQRAKSEKAYGGEEIEMDLFSRQSSESSDFITKMRNWRSDGSVESDEASGISMDPDLSVRRRRMEMSQIEALRVEISQDSDELNSEFSSDFLNKNNWLKPELSIESDDTADFLTKNLSSTCEELSRRQLNTKTSQDSDEMNDIFASKLDLSRLRETVRKERSLDSDETSGFVSKHSSETTDFSSKMSSSSGNFTTKHLSESINFGSIFLSAASETMSQHLSEPSDFVPKIPESPISEIAEDTNSETKSEKYGQFLKVEDPSGVMDRSTGAISKHPKRERFRKSKRIKHFNLRRIDDTDNDSSCDSEKYLTEGYKPRSFVQESVELAEMPSARLKEEVGLPKHLSRESSCDRYGLSRSERTIASFESDRFGPASLHDFESFCDAVMFTRRRDSDKLERAGRICSPRRRQLTVSLDSTNETDEFSTEDEILGRRGREPKVKDKKLRKSKSKRDLTQRLKCMLL